jgi:hypothetical protein
MRRVLLLGLVAGLAAAAWAAQLAGAGVVERIRVTAPVPGTTLPPGLVIELASPDEYTRATFSGMAGTWTGPRYQARHDPNLAGNAVIDWRLTYDTQPAQNTEQVVVRHVRNLNWRRDQRGGVSIPRVVGTRQIGTILAESYLMTPGGRDARFEAVVAFALDQNLHAVVQLDLREPTSDDFVVKQLVIASTWNRGQAFLAMTGIRLRGNLAPKVVSVRAFRRGRELRGKVVDRLLHPVVGTPTALELRHAGGRWVRVARGKTDERGFYVFRTGRRGAYRVTADMAGFKAESRPVLAGRRLTATRRKRASGG